MSEIITLESYKGSNIEKGFTSNPMWKSEQAQEEALNHQNELGEGAKKRKNLSPNDKIDVVMKEFKRGTLHSGDGKIVTNRKQAIAIAMSESGKIK